MHVHGLALVRQRQQRLHVRHRLIPLAPSPIGTSRARDPRVTDLVAALALWEVSALIIVHTKRLADAAGAPSEVLRRLSSSVITCVLLCLLSYAVDDDELDVASRTRFLACSRVYTHLLMVKLPLRFLMASLYFVSPLLNLSNIWRSFRLETFLD